MLRSKEQVWNFVIWIVTEGNDWNVSTFCFESTIFLLLLYMCVVTLAVYYSATTSLFEAR